MAWLTILFCISRGTIRTSTVTSTVNSNKIFSFPSPLTIHERSGFFTMDVFTLPILIIPFPLLFPYSIITNTVSRFWLFIHPKNLNGDMLQKTLFYFNFRMKGGNQMLSNFLQDSFINKINGYFIILYATDHIILARIMEHMNDLVVFLLVFLHFIPPRRRLK